MSIVGLHALMYSEKADETRAFLRDVLGMRSVDAGGGCGARALRRARSPSLIACRSPSGFLGS